MISRHPISVRFVVSYFFCCFVFPWKAEQRFVRFVELRLLCTHSKSFSLSHIHTRSVWPDVGVKRSPNVSKRYPRSCRSSLNIKVRFFKIAQKVDNNLGCIYSKFCHQELLKIDQSGHTLFKSNRWPIL